MYVLILLMLQQKRRYIGKSQVFGYNLNGLLGFLATQQCSGFIPDSVGGPYGMVSIKPGLAVFKKGIPAAPLIQFHNL